ncbi:hypothetical protein Hanom_Chr06g00502411 [Helianthus anomalus]
MTSKAKTILCSIPSFFVNNFIDNIIITSTIYLLVKLITHPQVWSVSIWLGCASCPVF